MKFVLDDGFEIPIEKVFLAEVPKDAILVLEHPGILSSNATENIRATFSEATGLKCVVLMEGMELKCILKPDK